jgi:hypothetical protein
VIERPEKTCKHCDEPRVYNKPLCREHYNEYMRNYVRVRKNIGPDDYRIKDGQQFYYISGFGWIVIMGDDVLKASPEQIKEYLKDEK